MEQLNNLDVVFLIIVGISALVGIARGMTKELLSIAGWVLAAAAVFYLVPVVEPMMAKYIASKLLANIVSGLAILIVFCIFWILTADRLGSMVRSSRLSALDRILGFVFGAARGALIVILLALLINTIIPEESKKGMFKDSQYFQIASNSAEPLKKLVPSDWFEKMKAKTEEMVAINSKDDSEKDSAKTDEKAVSSDASEVKEEKNDESLSDKLKKAADAVDNLKALQKSGEELFNELAQPKTASESSDEDDLSSDLDKLLDVLEDRMVTTDETTPEMKSETQEIMDTVKDKVDGNAK
ncbi:MAG: CvpA family protein [Alphaproteobacteria bacterium]|nr:CvpA family protein [Alphaproteobacteria bacterium]